MWEQEIQAIKVGDYKTIARCISFVENEVDGYDTLLKSLPWSDTPVIGITGPPGAGKSTVANRLIEEMVQEGFKVGLLCVDPSSPFNQGAVLGDRIRMSSWYNHPAVYIRSLASRGSLGGLSQKIIEITDLMKAAAFDFIIVETVGVGQSEIEITGLADITVVVLVPEAGDEIQTMKSGLMEIADIFLVNKADRPGAEVFLKNLKLMLAPAFHSKNEEIPILKSVASSSDDKGVQKLFGFIRDSAKDGGNDKKYWLLAEKVFQLVQHKRMHDVSKLALKEQIEDAVKGNSPFNLYAFADSL